MPEPGESISLTGLMHLAIDGRLDEVNTAMPGTVVKYDLQTGLASVRPAYKKAFPGAEKLLDLPVIPNVPVLMPGANGAFVRLPVAVHDTVLLVFAQRSLDRWLEKGGQVDPGDSRRFALIDAVAIPGLARKQDIPKPLGAADSLEVVNGRARLELTAQGKIALRNDFGDVLDILSQVIAQLQIATVGGVPLDPATVALLVTLGATLDQVKA